MRVARFSLAVVVAAGCGVQIGGDTPRQTDGAVADSPVSIDAAIDAPPDARPCTGGDQNMTMGGSCFLLFTATTRSWADANAACIAMNTQLAVLDTAEKHAAAKALAGTNNTWIGLTDLAVENEFRWVDPAVPLAFTAWDPMEPNDSNGIEDCGVIAGARGGDWDDRPCSDAVPGAPAGCCSYAYLCQF